MGLALSLLLLTVLIVYLIAFRAITKPITKEWKENALRILTEMTESSKGQSDSVYAQAFELETLRIHGQGIDAKKDSEHIEKVMNSNALEGNRTPTDVDHNEFVHSSNGKAANQVFGSKTDGEHTKGKDASALCL